MGYQKLKGVKVIPLGASNRFLNSALFNATSKAFGGWIYNASVEIGFSQQPTSITLDITLDAQDGQYKTNTSDFNIVKEDLKVSAPGGAMGESYYEIQFGDKVYKPMFISSFDITGSADSKTLKVKFLDYSIHLDKIYIALYKKQAYDPAQGVSFSARPNITSLCPGCVLDDPTFYEVEVNPIASQNDDKPANLVSLRLDAAAYFYNYKNRFKPYNIYKGGGISPPTPPFELFRAHYARNFKNGLSFTESWNSVSKTPTNGGMLDINGGTVVLGVEEFNQTMCGSAAEVSYNFTELISILAKSGLSFSKLDSLDRLAGSKDIQGIDKNPNYRKNYTGTLREVLGNWCADFALDFYVDGTRIHFVNLCTTMASQLEKDIEKITKVTNPSTIEGMGLNSNEDYAIASFTESADIADTYEQTLITFKVKPKRSEEKSKEKKNHCGFLAVHPLDVLNLNLNLADYTNMYGRIINRPDFLNKIWGSKEKHWYTNRSFDCIDKCSAIGKYSSIYRNIYAGSLICDNSVVFSKEKQEEEEEEEEEGVAAQTVGPKVTSSQMDGFNSFGFIPLYKVQPACEPNPDFEEEDNTGCGDEQARLDLIEKVFKSSGSQQRYIVNHKTFDIWIGFRNDEESDELVQWEKAIAENMYKYGILVKGPSAYRPENEEDLPFVPEDFAMQALEASQGIDYGSLKLLKVNSSSSPPFERYRFFEDLPFKDLFKTREEFLESKVRVLPFASLDNDWGSSQEVFDESLRVTNHGTANCNNYGQAKLLDDPNNPSAKDPDGNDTPPDSFSVADFQPKFEDLPDDIFEDESFSDLKAILINSKFTKGMLGKLIQSQKQKTTADGNLSYSQAQCPRLQLMIIPRVRNDLINLNPHLKVAFDFDKGENAIQQKNFFKKIYLESKEKAKDFLKSKCEYSLEDIVCDYGAAKNPKSCDSYTGAVAEDCVCLPSINDPRAEPGRLQAYEIGFINSRVNAVCPARQITISINVHHDVNKYNDGENVVKILANGGVGYLAEDEDYPVFIPTSKRAEIVYPRQSDDLGDRGVNSPKQQNSLYQGVLSQTATFQTRNSETIECHGSQWCGDTNVSKIQVINNEVAQDIDQLVDPQTKGFYSPVYDMQGNAVKSIAHYHSLMAELSDPDKTSHILPARTMNFEIIGNALEVGSLAQYLHPHRGLKSLSFTLSPEGFRSNLSFTNRSLKLPKPEAILNKIRSVF